MDTINRFEGEMLNWGRLLLDGIPFADLVAAHRRDPAMSWFDYWNATGQRYEQLGDDAIDRGNTLTGGEWLWLASLTYQYAQFMWFDERRPEGQRRKAEAYRRAAPHLRPAAERVELRFRDTVIPGYLRLPDAVGPYPCAVLLGGLESTKEESYRFENLLLRRGVATFAFDGPGQGEMYASVALSADFDAYTSAVVDHLETRPELDASRFGVLGRSLGGYYALQSACAEPRFRACVSWGGFVDESYWELETPATKECWRYASKADSIEEAKSHVQACLDVKPHLDKLRCPTYVLHGALDETPISQIETLRQLAVNAPLTVVIEPEGDHCCHNLGPAPRVAMADWLVDQLG